MLKRKWAVVFLLIILTLLGNATELKRNGWNLISVCQDINRSDINMTNIEEIQNQDGEVIYTGDWESHSNLHKLISGYGYWVKGEINVSFNSGESRTQIEIPLLREGWNLLGACADISTLDINMSQIDEIQSQDGKTLFTGEWSEHSTLDKLTTGYGYWVKGDVNDSFISKPWITIPSTFQYETIDNQGNIIGTEHNGYTIKLYSDYNETINPQSNHLGIIVNLNGSKSPLMMIQGSYEDHNIVVGVYDNEGILVGVSDLVMIDGNMLIDITTIGEQPSINNPPRFTTTLSDLNITEGLNHSFQINATDDDNDTLNYEWSVNGVIQNVDATNFSYLFDTIGTFVIKCVVDDGKVTASTEATITVNETPPSSSQAQIKGNLSNANVRIYRVEDNGDKTLLFEETTSADGSFNEHKDELEDSKYYIYEVSNGIDAFNSIENNGTIRAVGTGSLIKEKGISVSLVSEMAYIFMAKDLKYDFNVTNVEIRFNEVASTILTADISGDTLLNVNDTLKFDYNTHLSNINPRYSTSELDEVITSIYQNSLAYSHNIMSSIINQYETGGYLRSITLSKDGSKAFMANSSNGLIVLDTSNLYNPIKIANKSNAIHKVVLSADESRAFATSDNEVFIYDISDLSNITEISTYVLSTSTPSYRKLDITLSSDGNTLFTANGTHGLSILDISDPSNPNKIGTYNTGNRFSKVVLSNDETKAFIADRTEGILILDISDLENPTKIGAYGEYSTSYVEDLVLSSDNTKAFITSYYYGLYAIDITDPSNPRKLDKYSLQGYLSGITLSDDETKAFVANGTTGVSVIDITTPTDLQELTVIDTKSYAYNITLSSDTSKILVADGSNGLIIIDLDTITFKSNKLGNYSASGIHTIVASKDNTKVYINNSFSFCVIDVTNPTSPERLDYDYLSDSVLQIVLSEDETKAYIANDDKGLVIMDITDATNITEIVEYNTGYTDAYGIAVSADDTKAYLASRSNGLVIVDISEPTKPLKIARYDTDGSAYAVVLSKDGNTAYIADYHNGLVVLDVSRPSKPIEIGHYDDSISYAQGIALSEDETKAFISTVYGGMIVLDLTDPTNPKIISQYEIASKTTLNEENISISGEMNITMDNPLESENLATYNTDGYTYKITLSTDGTKAFIADGNNGLVVIDITDLNNLKESAHYPTNGDTKAISLSRDETTAFSADYNDGLNILDLTMFRKLINQPIITTPSTTQQTSITTKVTAPVGSKIILDGVNTGIVIPSSHEANITLDTSGADGNKTFELQFVNIEKVYSDTTTIIIEKDSTPTLFTNPPEETNENSVNIEITGEIGATIHVNGSDYGTIAENGRQSISLDTSGDDGDKVFTITVTGGYGMESNPLVITIEKDTNPPEKPTLTEIPTQTYRDYVEIEVNGEVGALVIIDENATKEINSTGKVLTRLDTSGEDGDKKFTIKLKDSVGNESEALLVTIKKETATDTGKDSDSDHIPDVIETLIGTNPNNADENENDILDGLESTGNFGDQFFDKQWHIRSLGTVVNDSGISTIEGNDLNLLSLYHKYMGYNSGNPIIVQVVDNGVDADHEDLINNMDLTRSYHHSSSGNIVGDPSPTDSSNTHGTMVAGIIGAEAFNGKGVRGIAPFVKIAGSNWLEYQSTSATEKVWLTGDGANEIAVSNNSWGYPTGTMTSRNTSFEAIAQQGTATLRDGKGRIYVKSAGNDRSNGGNSNLTYVSNNRFVIAVSALKHDNTHASYSSPGGNLLISGYSGDYYSNSPTIGTTINMGLGGSQTWDGDENKNYTYKMNGTSAAGPTVAASIALVLEACPDLGWRDVKYLLAKHGKKVDSSNESWIENGAGLWHSSDYGYGLVNPEGMIGDCNSSYVNLDVNKSTEVSGTVNLDLADGKVATIGGLNVSDNMTIEWVELTVDSNHTRASDYRVELISPAGTTSKIVDPTNPSGAWMDGGFRFGCAGFIGESSSGEWKVRISDFDPTSAQLSGNIKNLTIKIHGH